MTVRPSAPAVTLLHGAALRQVRGLLTDPVVSCFAEARLFPVGPTPEWGRPAVLAVHRAQTVAAAAMLGANLVPIGTDAPAREVLAEELVRMGRTCSSIVGPADEVLDLWRLLQPAWGPAREIRPDQPLLAIGQPPLVAADLLVQPVPEHRLDDFLPACIAMFTEEVGVDPRAGGAGQLYRHRVGDLLRARRAFASWDDGRVVFKAEFGAVTRRAVQVQGVWVDPERRGEGLAPPGMAAVVEYGFAAAPLVTLYVNGYNASALATYRRVGFRRVGTFATVLF